MKWEKHPSQFSLVVGKRLMFPWSRSLLIPVLSCFHPAASPLPLKQDSPVQPSPTDYFCPHSSLRGPPSPVGWRLLTQIDD